MSAIPTEVPPNYDYTLTLAASYLTNSENTAHNICTLMRQQEAILGEQIHQWLDDLGKRAPTVSDKRIKNLYYVSTLRFYTREVSVGHLERLTRYRTEPEKALALIAAIKAEGWSVDTLAEKIIQLDPSSGNQNTLTEKRNWQLVARSFGTAIGTAIQLLNDGEAEKALEVLKAENVGEWL